MDRTCVAICGTTQLFREGLQSLLRNSRFTVSLLIRSWSEVVDEMDPRLRPDVVIFSLGAEDDFDGQPLPRGPRTADSPRSVLLAEAPSTRLLHWAASAGVQAVLSTDISARVLQRSLELVMLGQRLFPAPDAPCAELAGRPMQVVLNDRPPPALERPVPPRPSPVRLTLVETQASVQLSDRETQILRCLIEGAPNKRIARDLEITEATVKVHIKGLLRKLRVNNRTQAAIWGVGHGYDGEPGPARNALRSEAPFLRAAP